MMLNIHNTEENAFIVHNYPYGFKRTDIKYWIESNKKGDRFISMTLNPKTKQWNKPKKSTYNSIMVMLKTITDDKPFISYLGLYPTTDRDTILKYEDSIKGVELNDFQKEQLRVLKAYSKAYENVSYSIRGEETTPEKEKEQKEIQDIINKSVGHHYHKEDF